MSDAQGSLEFNPSVEDLRKWARVRIQECPTCRGNIKVYRRKLNSGMAAVLCWLVGQGGFWCHLRSNGPSFIADQGGDFAHLRHWRFIEEQPLDGDGKRHNSGVWRPTPAGCRFAEGSVDTPSHVFLQSPGNLVLGFEETTITVVEALGKHFFYQALMRGED